MDLDEGSFLNIPFRNTTIVPFMIGKKLCLYNGAWFLTKNVEETMLHFKTGVFSITKCFDAQNQSRVKRKKKIQK